ncbi:MAG: OmpA/MotB family protein, partial [Janthinobacterium lividum]
TQQILQQAQKAQAGADLEAATKEVEDYRGIEKQLNDALTAKDDQNQVTYRITSDGLVVGLVADNVFFANASADVEPKGLEVLSVIGPILAALPNGIAVQGHTNSLPLSSSVRYRDNWDLSSNRANTVLNFFRVNNGVSPQRLSSTGYADSRPLYPDSDARALAGNRRVDLTVASPSTDAVKALLPQVAAGLPTTNGPAEVETGEPTTLEASAPSVTNAVVTGIVPDLAGNVTH